MDNIQFTDFTKVDIRAGTILSIEEVPKSKKLLKLEVSFGPVIGNRIILAGLKDTGLAIGYRILAVINLEPREMMGSTSHGMLLAGATEDGKLYTASCGPVPDGAKIG